MQTVNLDGQTVSPADMPSWWRVPFFKVCLWLQCFFAGQSGKYSVLVAQARLETDNFRSWGFNNRNNPFGMRPSQPNQGAPNATRLRPKYWSAESNGFAEYTTYWSACKDRLQWDAHNRIDFGTDDGFRIAGEPSSNVTQYMAAVLAAGYVPLEERASYLNLWKALYKEEAGDGSGLKQFLLIALGIGVSVAILYTAYKWWKKKKR
jgi:hypothetical protein